MSEEKFYSDELEKFIDATLVDGELDEDEIQLLYKKAEEHGIPLDEFKVIINSRLQLKQQKMKKEAEAEKSAPKSNKYGDVRNCPSCGELVESFNAQCTTCGYDFTNVEANASIQRLLKMLDDVKQEQIRFNKEIAINKKTGKTFAESFFGSNEGIHNSDVRDRQQTIIANFPIPNSKEEILEFLTLASSRLVSYANSASERDKDWINAWLSKIEEVNTKSSIALKGDKIALEQIAKIVEKARDNAKIATKKSKKESIIVGAVFGALGLVAMIGMYFEGANKDIDEQQQLKSIVQSLIIDKDFERAKSRLVEITDENAVAELEVKIQYEELKSKIDSLELTLVDKDISRYKKKELALLNLTISNIEWKPSAKFASNETEKHYSRLIQEHKQKLLTKIPSKYLK